MLIGYKTLDMKVIPFAFTIIIIMTSCAMFLIMSQTISVAYQAEPGKPPLHLQCGEIKEIRAYHTVAPPPPPPPPVFSYWMDYHSLYNLSLAIRGRALISDHSLAIRGRALISDHSLAMYLFDELRSPG